MDATLSHDSRDDKAPVVFVKGGLVGIANVIPGVSGGTFALILGIFDRLVSALNNIGPRTVKVTAELVGRGFRSEARARFAEEMRRIDLLFLMVLGVGAVVAIGASSFLIDYLLKEHYTPTLAFFVGLILPSIIVPWRMMERRGSVLLGILPGVALTVGVAVAMPETGAGAGSLPAAFLSGAVAMSAMILPGISGSYVLLVMGQYQNMLAHVTGVQKALAAGALELASIWWLGAFALGVVVGLLAFARLLAFLLRRLPSLTMAFLIGLLLGSLYVLWPYKNIEAGAAVVDRSGVVKQEVRIATAPNRLPQTAAEAGLGLGAMAAGLIGSAGLIALGGRRRSSTAAAACDTVDL